MSNKEFIRGKDWVKYGGPYFDGNEQEAAIRCILDGWLVLGKNAQKFESRFPKLLGKTNGILVNSGSSANLIIMSVLKSKRFLPKLHENSRVITPIAGFPTTINPILQNGFIPDFVDIELDSLNLNIQQVEEKAKNGADVLFFAHALGCPANMDEIMRIVEEYDLILLEDCCDALSATYRGKLVGSFGTMASCSFFPAHHITMGEGGFVAMDDTKLELIARSFREWGRGCYCVGEKANLSKQGTCGCRFNNWLPDLPDLVYDHKFVYEEIGYNLKPLDLQAAMGLVQLDKLEEIVEKKRYNHSFFMRSFSKYNDYFYLPKWDAETMGPSWHAFALTIKESAPFNRKEFCDYLENNKIQTRPYFAGNIAMHPAYNHLGINVADFPVANLVTSNTFFLGVSPNLTEEQRLYIEEVVDKYFEGELWNL